MKTDREIQQDVKEELKWESRINGSKIQVDVKEGLVALSGTIDSLIRKTDAEQTAIRVSGVKGVFNGLEVKIPASSRKADSEIQDAILTTIKWNSSINGTKIKMSVQNGKVTLEGEVPWAYQKSRLGNLAADIIGVTEVNNIVRVISSYNTAHDAEEKIKAALKRNRYLNTNRITVTVEGDKAILTGEVRGVEERTAVETAAWSAPGINEVENRLLVSFSEIYI